MSLKKQEHLQALMLTKSRSTRHITTGGPVQILFFSVLYESKQLKLAFAKCKIPFPLEKHHAVLQEFHSLMKSLHDLQVKAQSKKETNEAMIYVEFVSIRNTTLNTSAPLLIFGVGQLPPLWLPVFLSLECMTSFIL